MPTAKNQHTGCSRHRWTEFHWKLVSKLRTSWEGWCLWGPGLRSVNLQIVWLIAFVLHICTALLPNHRVCTFYLFFWGLLFALLANISQLSQVCTLILYCSTSQWLIIVKVGKELLMSTKCHHELDCFKKLMSLEKIVYK